MRIHSITVRNYRIHRELKVELDPSRTLIGGPNECGKSTLVEAAHRALFLKAKVGGDAQKSMVSKIHPGHPEVELTFEKGGRSYQLFKRFSGASGVTRLTEIGGKQFSDDEAETTLAELLGVELTGGGRGASDRASLQWAHLWVWQGKSGEDPVEHANSQKDSLLERLQISGGAAPMQSELDARVATKAAELHDTLFTSKGVKANSELDKAQRAEQEANAALQTAEAALTQLEQAISNIESAEKTLQESKLALAQLEVEKAQLNERINLLASLRDKEKERAFACQQATEEHDRLKKVEKHITNFREQIAQLETELQPRQTRTEQLREAENAARSRANDAEQQWVTASANARTARLRFELSRAQVTFLEKTQSGEQLKEKKKRVEQLREQARCFEKEMAKLPKISQSALNRLRKLETAVSNTQAALNAMGATVEILSAKETIRVGEETVQAGMNRILTDNTIVAIGDAQLRIRPGGGVGLAEARKTLHDAEEELKDALQINDVTSVAHAAETLLRLDNIKSESGKIEVQLNASGAETLDQELAEAQNDRTEAEEQMRSKAAMLNEPLLERSLPDAREWFSQMETLSEEMGQKADACERARKKAVDALATATNTLQEHQQSLQADSRSLDNFKAQLAFLLETNGDDPARQTKMAQALSAKTSSELALQETRDAIAAQQPDSVTRDQSRLERVARTWNEARRDAEDTILASRTILQNASASDPQAAVKTARAQVRSATEHLELIQCRANAIKRLKQLFDQEQQSLADQFTRPLAEKVAGYLQCVFGVQAHVKLAFNEEGFSGLEIVRPRSHNFALEFTSLSGGTREQVAAAVRLATAEILASGHDGCLPVVFDDAFAYSDPDRVQIVQRMLDCAADRGLQVIVLTCAPNDYSSLGARQIRLSAAPPVGANALAKPIHLQAGDHQDAERDVPAAANVSQASKEAFLNALREAGGSRGNLALRQQLGWDEGTYDSVKAFLLYSAEIVSGRGKGGSVSLKGASNPE